MIKIINGVFGFNNGTSIVPKTPKDEPFEAPKNVEERLVKLGVAEYVTKAEAKAEAVVEVAEATETVAEVEEETEATESTEEATEEAEPIDLQALKFDELKELAKKHGATDEDLKPLNSKAKVIELIEKLFSEEAEEVPDLNSDDGVVE